MILAQPIKNNSQKSYIDNQIIEMRLERAYIKTIHSWVISQCPLVDELVLLSRVLTTLDEQNFHYSRKEVRTSFNRYFKEEFHGNKISSLNWLCINCSKTPIYPILKLSVNKKGQGEKKQPVAVTCGGNKGRTTPKIQLKSISSGYPHKPPQNRFKGEDEDE